MFYEKFTTSYFTFFFLLCFHADIQYNMCILRKNQYYSKQGNSYEINHNFCLCISKNIIKHFISGNQYLL